MTVDIVGLVFGTVTIGASMQRGIEFRENYVRRTRCFEALSLVVPLI